MPPRPRSSHRLERRGRAFSTTCGLFSCPCVGRARSAPRRALVLRCQGQALDLRLARGIVLLCARKCHPVVDDMLLNRIAVPSPPSEAPPSSGLTQAGMPCGVPCWCSEAQARGALTSLLASRIHGRASGCASGWASGLPQAQIQCAQSRETVATG